MPVPTVSPVLPAAPGELSAAEATGTPPPRGGRSASAVRRDELSAFLRSRRERITPSQAGIPLGGRRRTPGLRREEVAQLAGVGVTWYTWLEQGRDIKVSDQVLEAIARTLRLDPDERLHLFTLAGAQGQAVTSDLGVVPDSLLLLLEQLMPFPACVQTSKYDLLAYNKVYSRLISNMDEIAPERRNCMMLAFTDPAWRRAIPDWEVVTSRMVAQFRGGMAEHVAEPSWKAMLKRLRLASPEFAALWDKHEVSGVQNKGKRYENPLVGLLTFDVTNTWLQPQTGSRLLIYVPADEQTRVGVARIAELIEQSGDLEKVTPPRAV